MPVKSKKHPHSNNKTVYLVKIQIESFKLLAVIPSYYCIKVIQNILENS